MAQLQENRFARILRNYLIIAIGSVIYAVGFQFFLYPNNITSGGVVGTSMIIMDVFAGFDLILTDDPMLAAVIGGVVKGTSLGMIYYVGGTTGGLDIVVKILRQKLASVNFGTIMLALDTIIIAVYAMVLGRYESAMYSLIAMYVTTKVVDLVLYGIDNACLCYIISNSTEEITKEIVSGPLHRGVTLLEGRGAYSGAHRDVMMCVIKRQQIGQLKHLVRNVDEKAFFIVTNAKNVFGNGFESFTEVR